MSVTTMATRKKRCDGGQRHRPLPSNRHFAHVAVKSASASPPPAVSLTSLEETCGSGLGGGGFVERRVAE